MELLCVTCHEEFFSDKFTLHCSPDCLFEDLQEASLVIKASTKFNKKHYNPHHEKLYGEGEVHGQA